MKLDIHDTYRFQKLIICLQAQRNLIAALGSQLKLRSITAGDLRTLDQTYTEKTGAQGHVFFMLALSRLSKDTGLLAFVSHIGDDRVRVYDEDVVLEPGDGIIWRGGQPSKRITGSGGCFLVLRYH
jgi:hypothetical protein